MPSSNCTVRLTANCMKTSGYALPVVGPGSRRSEEVFVQPDEPQILAVVGVEPRPSAVEEIRGIAHERDAVLQETIFAVRDEADQPKVIPGAAAIAADQGGELPTVL